MVERERVAVLDIDLADGNFDGAFEHARTGDLERTRAADLAAVDRRPGKLNHRLGVGLDGTVAAGDGAVDERYRAAGRGLDQADVV